MWSGRSSFTSLVVGVFVVYVVHTCWVMYGIVYTRPCAGGGNCIQPYLARRPKLQVSARVGPFSPEWGPGLGKGVGSPTPPPPPPAPEPPRRGLSYPDPWLPLPQIVVAPGRLQAHPLLPHYKVPRVGVPPLC